MHAELTHASIPDVLNPSSHLLAGLLLSGFLLLARVARMHRGYPRGDEALGHNKSLMCKSRSGAGICVTGEARSFAMPEVRASLKEYLAAIGAVNVHMHIARRASSSLGWTHTHDKALRPESVRSITYSASKHHVANEFSTWNARVTLVNTSDCKELEWRDDACCRLAVHRNTSRRRPDPPGAYLQYASFSRCVHDLVAESPCLALVVRTRPDNLYLNATAVAKMSLESVKSGRPALIRKGERGTYSVNPGDQYLVAPGALAMNFFSSFDSPINAACQRGIIDDDPRWERLAWDPVPELTWMHRSRQGIPYMLQSFPIVQGSHSLSGPEDLYPAACIKYMHEHEFHTILRRCQCPHGETRSPAANCTCTVDVLGRPVCNVGIHHWRGGSDVVSREDCRNRSLYLLERLNKTQMITF